MLQIIWELKNNTAEFHKRVPVSEPIVVGGAKCCQQFLISRNMIHKRPLSVWKELLHIIGES